ncbi:MAG: TIGR01212 family radical SAM protein, partial [Butyricicoccus sp.]
EAYVSVVCDQLEVLPPEVVIQRLTGDGKGTDLLAPDWSRNKRAVLAAIDREMKRRDSVQGCKL